MKKSSEDFLKEYIDDYVKMSPEERKKDEKRTKYGCITGMIISFIIILSIVYTCSNNSDEDAEAYTSTTIIKKPVLGSIEWKEEQITLLKKDSSEIANTDYKSLSQQSNAVMSDAIDYLETQRIWGGFIESQKDFYETDKRANIPLKFIQNKAVKILKQVMPSYRKSFAKNLGSILWENDIYISVSGSNNTILNITGAVFAANKNIAEFQNTINRDVQHFGFKEIRYRWYKNAEEYTSYKY